MAFEKIITGVNFCLPYSRLSRVASVERLTYSNYSLERQTY